MLTRTFDILEHLQTHFPDKEDVFVSKEHGVWRKYSLSDYRNYSVNFCAGLLELGLKKGDMVASISNNRPEWNFMDVGMAMAGIIHVPVFSTISMNEFEHIIKHSEAKILIISDQQLFKKFSETAAGISGLQQVYTINEVPGAKNWMEIIKFGESCPEVNKQKIEEAKNSITPDDTATLIYTSGTTGNSKGVLLTHRNLVTNFIEASKVFMLKPEFKYLSILPLCHVGGRMGNYQTQYCGSSIYYAENMNAIASNMKEVKPHGFDAVPRILEKILDNIIARGNKLQGMKKKIFFASVKLGLRYRNSTKNSLWYRLRLSLADKLIFSKWREAIGGNIKIVGCGGASLPHQVEKIFWAAGVKIINMYGLTETSPVITINRAVAPDVRLGSVGMVIDDVSVKIASDGEILCKGPNVMKAYHKDPDATAAVFDEEGWFKTGDIGYFEKNRFLIITDRKKEMFKLTNGKFIAPQAMEIKIKESVYVDQAFVVGDGQKFVSAIILPNFDALKEWCLQRNIAFESNNDIIDHPEVKLFYQQITTGMNKNLPDYQRVKKILLTADEWTPAGGELSHTLKLKRRYLYQKYEHLIDQIYNANFLS